MSKISDNVSHTRRHMMMAAAAMPLATKAAAASATGGATAALPQHDIVISGRLLDAAGTPVSGAQVELGVDAGDASNVAVTDADGRFVSRTRVGMQASGRPASLAYRIRHRDFEVRQAAVRMTPASSRPGQAIAHRDEDGTWRAAFGIQLA